MSDSLEQVLATSAIRTLFQPIIDGATGAVFGYEALSRGAAGSPLELPHALFAAAIAGDQVEALERACIDCALRSYAQRKLDGRLFLNVNPRTLLGWNGFAEWLRSRADAAGLDPHLLTIEVTEHGNVAEETALAAAIRPLRALGCEIAIDDLGAGSSGLKSWSAIRPEFVKVDRYFIAGVEEDAVRAEILRAVVEMGRATGSQIVAEGIEKEEQLGLAIELGINYLQGFLLGRPETEPLRESCRLRDFERTLPGLGADCAEQLANPTPPAPAMMPVAAVVDMFRKHPDWRALAVVDGTRPVGLVRRDELLILLSRPLHPEIYNRKPIASVMDATAIQVDARARLDQVSRLVTGHVAPREQDDFIITRGGDYLGLGRTIDLLRHITAQQIQSARQANPLTGLPGNREIHSQMQRWVLQRRGFVACHLDLDHFKPFNDTYGYSQGDQVLLHVAAALTRCARPRVDFIGHIGGDDFVLLLRSQDWSLRLAALMEELAVSLPNFHSAEHRRSEAFEAVGRDGNECSFPLLSATIAAFEVEGDPDVTVEQVTEGLLRTKAEAKSRAGPVCLLASRAGLTELARKGGATVRGERSHRQVNPEGVRARAR